MTRTAHIPANKTIELLTAIWQQVLQRSPIGVDDNFFDRGGNPALANQLFAQITKEYGRELSPLTIYYAPTIAALAALLEDPGEPRLGALVKLRDSAQIPPIFLVPGLCSSVMEFFKLVKCIDSPRPIFGLHSRGMDGLEEPFERVEDFARFYLDAIRTLQPHGPYILVGYSFGGLVALEMAQQLSKSGEATALLAMMEAYPFRDFVPLGQRAGIFARRVLNLVPRVLRRMRLLSEPAEHAWGMKPDLPQFGEKFTPIMRQVCLKGFQAFEHYRPARYDGRVILIRAAIHAAHLPTNASAVWNPLAGELMIETTPGGHWGMISTEFASLAALLTRHIKTIPFSIEK